MRPRKPLRCIKLCVSPFSRRASIAVLMCAAASQCFATDRFWNNASGGTFNVASNWSGGVVPGASDIAHFGLTISSPQVYLVNFSTNVTNQAIKVEDDFVTFNLATSSPPFLILRTYST